VSAGTRSQLLDIDRPSHRAHPSHAGERTWTETSCSVDLWTELLNARGRSVNLLGPPTEMGRADKAAMDGLVARHGTWKLQV
jgi:hypothetical protein